jgi:hypothetical protein
MKLNKLLETNALEVFGFPVFKELENHAQNQAEGYPLITISTDTPALMLERNYGAYWTPILPDRSHYKTAQEIIDADLDVKIINVFGAEQITEKDQVTIVSYNQETTKLLKSLYLKHTTLSKVTADDIKDKDVVGTLPINLATKCRTYTAAVINSYNRTADGEVTGDEFRDRIRIFPTIVVIGKDI